ncbi:hypothetical protein FD723_27405 [Nostoc sp. C052]|uniref:hypothetical protein n=1 Tax=Nostoc sp. C052 TaxID=2576902 RepID=UPI0015C36401|nr:hypothetical protein [Nostoc sp. C052]QLE43798.1 hypothetical protein FD723_27405 [Nostoc sp. C052]
MSSDRILLLPDILTQTETCSDTSLIAKITNAIAKITIAVAKSINAIAKSIDVIASILFLPETGSGRSQNQYIVCSQVKNTHPRGSFILRNTSFVMKLYVFLEFRALALNLSNHKITSHALTHERTASASLSQPHSKPVRCPQW